MPTCLKPSFAAQLLFLVAIVIPIVSVSPVGADEGKKMEVPQVFKKPAPENLEDLKAMEKHSKMILEKVIPCTVCVRVGQSSGSGVIIDEKGHILTAAHVSSKPDQDVQIILHDGKKIKGKTLGLNRTIDSGLIKITEENTKLPFIEMGKSSDLQKGDWCITTGHPGGFQPGRTPVVRLGRIIEMSDKVIRTDCTLVGGDSGGPLFDVEGKVIGIHSRIGGSLTTNFHVPVDTYRDTWDRLVKGEAWGGGIGGFGGASGGAWLGLEADPESNTCKILKVQPKSPAEKAGFKSNDVVKKFDGQKIETFDDLRSRLGKKKPGDQVTVEVDREGESVTLKVTLGKREE